VLALALAFPLAGEAEGAAAPSLSSAAEAVAAPAPVMPGTWQLAGFDPGLPNGDLEPLRKLVGKAQIVALGESHFASGGFHQLRHRVTRYLVENLGFRMFAIDSGRVLAERTAAYVATCDGSADEALGGLWGSWQSVELRELLQWMCAWNSSHPKAKDKVRLVGFNTHDQSPADAAALTEFLLKLDWAADDPRIVGLSECYGVVEYDLLGRIPPARYAACVGSLDAISQYFTADAKKIIKKTSKSELEWAKLHLVGLRAEEDLIAFGGTSHGESNAALGAGLAYNVVKLRDLLAPKAKVVVWVGNSQVAKGGPAAAPWGFVTMGTLLRQSQGTRYLAIALGADETNVDWGEGPTACGLVAAYGRPGSYEQALRDLGLGDLLVDLRAGGVVPAVLPDGEHALGDATIDVKSQFDALLYLDVSPKMTPLAWAPCH
jgi:erythromycin esterase